MIHCTPVAESERSSWIVGIAIATIVWSMKVIETAKIIAARISLLFWRGWLVHACRLFRAGGDSSPLRVFSPPQCRRSSGSDSESPPRSFSIGAVAGARSRTASLGSGAAMGAYLGVMSAFPLLAIGLATS